MYYFIKNPQTMRLKPWVDTEIIWYVQRNVTDATIFNYILTKKDLINCYFCHII